jgi:hypothetical protein
MSAPTGVVVADHDDQAGAHDGGKGLQFAPDASPGDAVAHWHGPERAFDVTDVGRVEHGWGKIHVLVEDSGSRDTRVHDTPPSSSKKRQKRELSAGRGALWQREIPADGSEW